MENLRKLMDTMEMNGKPKKSSAKKKKILVEMSKNSYENPMNISANFKSSKLWKTETSFFFKRQLKTE